jgi:hypothetical protein
MTGRAEVAAPAGLGCAICRRPLATVTTGAGQTSYHHTEPAGHRAVPVPLDDPDPRCDFCSGDGPHWALPVADFTRRGDDDEEQASIGDWFACDLCAALIREGRWNDMALHSVRARAARYGHVPTAAAEVLSARSLLNLWQVVRDHATGPIQRREAMP